MSSGNDVTIKIGGDLSPVKNDLAKLPKQITGVAMEIATGPLGMAVGVIKTVEAMGALATRLDTIKDKSAQAGIGVEFAQELEYAAERTGIDSGTILAGFRRIKEAAQEMNVNPKAYETMHKLGLTYESVKDLSPEELFKKVTGAMNEMGDGAERNAIAQGLLGRGWQELLPFIREYQDLGKEARSKGLIFSKEDMDIAEQFADKLHEMSIYKDKILMNTGAMTLGNAVLGGINANLSGDLFNQTYGAIKDMTGFGTGYKADDTTIGQDLGAVVDALKSIVSNTSNIPGSEPVSGGRK